MFNSILATIIVSAISLAGILLLSKQANKKKYIKSFIGIATGTLLAVVFLDMLPHAIEHFEDPKIVTKIILASIVAFFIIEKIIHYHHCSCEDEQKHHQKTHLIINNLIGDGLHNFVDGTIIASAFIIDIRLGITTTIAVALHEIPQEVSDFSILVYAGLSRIKAAIYNLIFGLTSVLGVIFIFIFSSSIENLVPILLAIASGNFIYLAMSDLIPELHHETEKKRIWLQPVWIIIGILIIYTVISITHK